MNNDDGLERARERQLRKYLDGLEESEDMELSNCCNAQICQDSDICCDCKEHCTTKAQEAELSRDDYYDQKMEEERERQWEARDEEQNSPHG